MALTAVHGLRARPRDGVHRALAAPQTRPLTRPRSGALPLLAPLPRAALRGGGARSGAPVMDPAPARRNLRCAWSLALLFGLIFAGTILIAVLYLQLD